MLSSCILSYSFSPLFYCTFVIQDLKKMFFIWCMLLFLIFMVLMGNSHDRVHTKKRRIFVVSHSLKMKEGIKELKVKVRVKLQTNLTWLIITTLMEVCDKLDGGRGGGTAKFLCKNDYHKGKPYIGSCTYEEAYLWDNATRQAQHQWNQSLSPNIKWRENKIHQERGSNTKKE